MPRHCTICCHPQRAEIEASLGAGSPYRRVASTWNVSVSALLRHIKSHRIPPLQTESNPSLDTRPGHPNPAPASEPNAVAEEHGAILPCPVNDGLEPSGGDDLTLARLREIVRMVFAGKTNREIAAHFSVTERTVSRWRAEAHRRRLETFRNTSPEDLFSGLLFRLSSLEAELIALQYRAAAAGDHRTVGEMLRQRRALIRDTAIVGEKVGYFSRLQWVPPDNEFSGKDVLLEAVRIAADPSISEEEATRILDTMVSPESMENHDGKPENFY